MTPAERRRAGRRDVDATLARKTDKDIGAPDEGSGGASVL